MMAVMETIKPEVTRHIISDFYHKNLIKKKALYLKAFFEDWLLAHNITPSDGEGGYWGERIASQGSRLSTKPHKGLKKLSKKDEKKLKWNIHLQCGIQIQCQQTDNPMHTPQARSEILKDLTCFYY